MVQLVEETQKFTLSREVLVAMEETILKTLQFQIRFVDVPFFLERFKRLFDLDRTDNRSVQISQMAGRFSKFALREGQFLDFKPS